MGLHRGEANILSHKR